MKRQSKDQQGKEMQADKGFLESLVDTAQVLMVVLDTEGRIVLFNRACQETTGYSAEEVLGRNWFDLFLPERVKEGAGEVFQKLLDGQLPSYYENTILTKDGQERLIEWDHTFLRDEEGTVHHVIGTGRDITERKRAEEALRESEERFRSLSASAPVGIFLTDADGRCIYANAHLQAIAGLTLEESLGYGWNKAIHPDDREAVLEKASKMASKGREFSREFRILTPQGESHWVHVRTTAMFSEEGEQIRRVGTVEDITERKQAEEALARHNRELAALNAVVAVVSRSLHLEEVARQAIDLIHQHLGYTNAALLLVDEKTDELYVKAACGYPQNVQSLRLKIGQEGITGWVAAHREPLLVPDVRQDPRYVMGAEEIRSELAVPVMLGEELLGVLDVESSGVAAFGEDDLKTLTTLAGQIAVAIGNARLFETERKRAAQLAVVNQVARQTASILDPDQLIQEIVTAIQQGFDYYNVILLLLDEAASELEMRAMAGGFEDMAAPDYRQAVGEGMIGRTAETGQPLLANDVRQEPHYIPGFPEEVLTRAELCVPLKLAGRVIGVLDVQDTQLNAFDEADLLAMETLADQIAVAIENARLFEETSRRFEETTALYQTSLDITAQLEMTELLKSIVERAVTLLRAESGGIYLYDPEREELRWGIGYGYTERYVGVTLKPGEGMAGRVFQTGGPLIVDDYRTWEGRAPVYEADRPFTAVLEVPLKWHDRIIGVLAINADAQKRTFNQDDVWLATLFANQAAVAIENARIYEEERKRITQLELIGGITQRVASILDLDELLHQVAYLIQDTFDYYYTSILLVEADSDELVLRASTGPFGETLMDRLRLKIGREGITGWVAHSGEPLVVNDVRCEPRYYPTEESKDTRSELAVPIKLKGGIIGVLDVQSVELNAFSQDDVSILQTLADQLAVAIENAQLYQKVTKRMREATALHRVSGTLMCTLNLDQLLESILEVLQRLFGHPYCSILLLDEETEELYVKAACGYVQAKVTGLRIKIGQEGITSWVAANRVPLNVPDVTKDDRYVEGIKGTRSEIAVPMLVGEKLVGVLDVQSTEVNAFGKGDLRILSSIAAQAVIAIERARLYEAEAQRRQEAETQRQAAVALTSTLDLEEALDRILEQLHRVVAYDSASVQLLRGDRLEIVGGRGFADPSAVIGLCFPVPGDNPNSQVIESGEPVILADAQAAHAPFREPPHNHIRSWLGVPVRFHERTIGLITLDSRELSHFTADHVRLAAAFANQAAVAIENARLYEAEAQRRQEAETLRQAAVALTSTLDLGETLDRILEQLHRVVAYDSASVQLLRGDHLEIVGGRGFVDPSAVIGLCFPVPGDNPNTGVIESGEPVILADAQAAHAPFREPPHDHIRSWLGVPVRFHERTIGLIALDSIELGHFTADHARLAAAFANQAAVAIENAHLFGEARRRAEELHLLFEATRDVSTSLELDEVLERVAAHLCWAAEATSGDIMVLDEGGERATVRTQYWSPEASLLERNLDIGTTYDLTRHPAILQALRENRPLVTHADDPNLEPTTRDMMADFDGRSALRIPMHVTGVLRGYALIWDSQRRHEWTDEQVRLCQTLANQAAVAIENARLYEQITALAGELEVRVQERTAELAHQAQELSSLYQASVALSSSLEVEEVLKALAQQAVRAVGAVDCTICELQEDALVIAASYSDPALPKQDPEIGRRYLLADYPSTREAIEKGQPLWVRVNDPLANEAERAELQEWGYTALLQVHIVSRDQVLGVVEVFDNKPEREFSEGDAALLQTIANQAGMAIERARLFQQVREERNHLELLYEVSRKLSASLDLEQILQDIFQVSVAATGASRGSIFVFDDEGRVAHRILMRDLSPTEGDDAIARVLRKGLAGWVLEHKQPTIVSDTSQDERWLPFPDDPEAVGSAMVIPFIERDQVRGLLTLVHPQPYHFKQTHLELLSSIAHQVAVVIERARLHEHARRRAVQLATAAEVSRDATSILDVGQLLTRTVDLIRDRFDLYYAGIFLVDEAGEYAILQAGTGKAGQQMLKQGHKLQVGGASMMGQCVANAQTRIALDVGEEAIRFDNPRLPETRTEMALPLISRGRVIGAMTIQSDRPAAFSGEDVTALQTLADQLANAIENARLYEETRRRAQEVAQQKEQTDAIMHSMADGLIVTDLENRLVLANPAAEELLKFRLEDAIGQDIGANIRDDRLRRSVRDTLGKQQAGYEVDIELTDPYDGARRIMRAHTAGVNDPSGQAMGIVTTLRDVTHERELQRLKDELVSTVSHELRTPMTSVLGFSELLLTRKLGEEKRLLYTETIHKEAQRLSALINDFLDIQRMERGQQEYHFEEVDLGELVRDAVATYSGQSEAHTLTLDLSPDLPIMQADPDRLRQVFGNLLSNAIKFSPGGGAVAVSVQAEGDEIHVAVSDEGIGIPAEALPHIFEKFFRVDSSDRREIQGAGLGLAICKGIVEAHLGRIWAESQEGVGTTVIFSLPLITRKGILVIDDEKDIRELFQRLLGERSYEVLTAANGQEGLSLMEEELPDLVILDIAMPMMNGYQFLEKVRGDRRTKDVPVIVISGVDTDIDRLRELGMDEFLSKPFSGTVLLETMQRLLKKSQIPNPKPPKSATL